MTQPTIATWSGEPYSNVWNPLGVLHDAHFKTFNATEAQTAKRARNQHHNALRTLESAFNYLVYGPEDHHEEPAEQDGYEKWLDEQEARKLAELIKGQPKPKPEYSTASELDADQYDSEFRHPSLGKLGWSKEDHDKEAMVTENRRREQDRMMAEDEMEQARR